MQTTSQQTELFHFQEKHIPIHDPYWDEIVLDADGQVEENGQLNLFYDASDEPPEPDEFPTLEAFESAWSDWERSHPDFNPAMTPFLEEADGDFMDVLEESLYPQERDLATCKTSTQQDVEVLEVENWQPVTTLPEQNNSVLEDPPTLPEHTHWVEQYAVKRGNKRHYYYRYCYYSRRIFHIHIPGGNSGSAIALERKEMIEKAIALGNSPIQIQNLIRGGFKVMNH